MIFLGLLSLFDPPKPGALESLQRLKELGISAKLITGDNHAVAAKIGSEAGLNIRTVLTGAELRHMTDSALMRRAARVDVFAEVDPNQKERIVLALKKAGYAVGYMGDGINDASALHAADVGISVDTAVDVTKQAADIVLLRKDLGVLAEGVREGRRAFANTLKYVFITTSANFGNMFSMAGASLFSSFLPLLPKQILLLNVLSDLPAMAIAADRLDEELVARPRRSGHALHSPVHDHIRPDQFRIRLPHVRNIVDPADVGRGIPCRLVPGVAAVRGFDPAGHPVAAAVLQEPGRPGPARRQHRGVERRVGPALRPVCRAARLRSRAFLPAADHRRDTRALYNVLGACEAMVLSHGPPVKTGPRLKIPGAEAKTPNSNAAVRARADERGGL